MDTWWIDKPHLLGSSNPTSTDLQKLRGDGFEVIISLLNEEQQKPRYDTAYTMALGYERHNIPVEDFFPPTLEQLNQFIRLIDGLRPGAKTIIHCEGGSGRTGTFAAAYWITKGMTTKQAIKHVREVRPQAIETQEQKEILSEFASRI